MVNALLLISTSRAASDTTTLYGRNLVFRATSIQDNEIGRRVPLGGAGNLRNVGDFYFSSVPSLVDMGTPTYVIVDNETVREQRLITFMIDTSMYTQGTWDKACLYGATPFKGSYDWFKSQRWENQFSCDPKVGTLQVSTVNWDDYVLKPSVYANNFMSYSNPTVEVGWVGDLFSYDWTHPNASSGISLDFQFDYQFVNLYADGEMTLDDLGEYKDTINIVDQQIGTDINNFNNQKDQGQLTVAEQNALQTISNLGRLGVVIVQNPNTNNYYGWDSPQTAVRMAPQINVPLLTPSDTHVNQGATVTIPSYGVKPSVYAATQVFDINWGEYDIITSSNVWDGSGVGTLEKASQICSGQSLGTGNTHGTKTVPRTVAVHLANKYVEQPFMLQMLVSCTTTLTGINSTVWLGHPQLSQDDKRWTAFFTGDTKAGIDLLDTYDWGDMMADVGLGFQQAVNAFAGPLIEIVIIVIIILAAIYILPGLFKKIGGRK